MDGVLPALPMPMTPLGDPHALAAHGNDVDTVAKGFEAMFASLLVKQLRESLQQGSLFGDDRGDVLGGMFDLFLGQHVAQSSPLGIGALVRQQLNRIRASDDHTRQTSRHA